MEKNEIQIQTTSLTTLEKIGLTTLSAKLTTSLIQKDRYEINVLKKKIVDAGKPKFEIIFGKDENGKDNSTTLQTMQKSVGDRNVVKLIVLLLEDLVNYFNVQRPMNIDQITDLSFEIAETLKTDRFEEIIAFFEGIKKERYGKIYERFDAPTFWRMYWGENQDDPNSYNFKKMDFCHLDATRNHTKDPIVNMNSELENKLNKTRTSGNAVADFTALIKNKFPKPEEK